MTFCSGEESHSSTAQEPQETDVDNSRDDATGYAVVDGSPKPTRAGRIMRKGRTRMT